ncbi:unnamed protein product [Rhizophagus irregularis]|uniref:Uncharacterized protein n=1 Tax=Rhizophagus irregularis TaxID=588596 RepID=A0A915ZET2_9GLOM|nr:unnamed protein product [Rhizophagus irregularis]CAB5372386.1 unnamed protein product [Rhizophagus irregularis]
MDSIRGAHRRRNSKWARIRLHTPRLARNNSAPENNFMMPVFEDIRTHGGMSVGCLFRETDFSISGQQTCIIQVKAGVDEKSDTRSQTTIYALLAGLEHAFLLNFSEGRVEKIKAANAQYMNDIARAVVALRGLGTINVNRRKLENIIQAEIRVTIAVQKKDAETTETRKRNRQGGLPGMAETDKPQAMSNNVGHRRSEASRRSDRHGHERDRTPKTPGASPGVAAGSEHQPTPLS